MQKVDRRSFMFACGAVSLGPSLFASDKVPVWPRKIDLARYVKMQPQDPDSMSEMLHYANWYRQHYGKPALSIDPQLQVNTVRWARYMNDTRNFHHSRDPVRENIAIGQQSPAEAYKTWMNSSGHRANLLSRVTLTGVAKVGNYYVQQFK